jgi:hypothetical protein
MGWDPAAAGSTAESAPLGAFGELLHRLGFISRNDPWWDKTSREGSPELGHRQSRYALALVFV